MSFSSQVKQELLRVRPEKHCCMLSELSALTQTCASLRLGGGGGVRIVYEVENTALAKRIFLLLKKRLEMTPTLEFTRYKRLGGRSACLLTLQRQDSRRLLIALGMLRESAVGEFFRGAPRSTLTRRCCQGSFLRGAFLGAGAMIDPEMGYHLEFSVNDGRQDVLLGILEKSDLHAAVIKRRGKDVIYIKRGDDVADCLTMMGAHHAKMEMENIRIKRDSRNQANRASNCDQANLNKQLAAGQRQAAAITRYSLSHSLSGLPKELQEIARLRMLNPDLSLEQLGQLLSPPLGKSGVNHRLRKLMAAMEESTPDGINEPISE